MGLIFCFYKCAIGQILCQRTMENEDHEVKSYPLIRAAMQSVGGGSMSLPQCKERMESSGKSQPPVKLLNLWLHPVFPHSTSWINLWPCLCSAAAHCHAWQSPTGAEGCSCCPPWITPDRSGKSLSLPTRSPLIQLSSCVWFSGFIWKKGKGWRMLYVTYFLGP